jgi:hypothetical protein
LGGRSDAGEWQLLASSNLPKGPRGVIVADLDRDHQEAPTKFEKVNLPGRQKVGPKEICLDADPDLCVFGEYGLLIRKNEHDPDNGTRSLEIVTQSEAVRGQSQIVAAAFLDLDQDGDLDLAASGAGGISLWLNLDNVEPLPFRGMKRYPYEPDQTAPDSKAYLDYLRTYQTRKQSGARFWKRLKAPIE